MLWDGTDLKTAKVPSTPADQSVGVIAAARSVTDGAEHFFHGTTVATNALLERTGARTALLTSPGYEDVLEIARQDRPSLYDPAARRPEPLVSRELRLSEVPEDLAGVESVAISLQYSFRHPSAWRSGNPTRIFRCRSRAS